MEVEEIGMREARRGRKRRSNKGKKLKEEEEGIKVVYISNPMMVNATASQFRALVQHLTGQHAELPPDLSTFHDAGHIHHTHSSDDSSAMTTNITTTTTVMPHDQVDPNCYNQGLQVETEAFQGFDPNLFTTDIMDNISAFVPPASLFYQSAPHPHQFDDLLPTLDALL